MKAVPAAAAIFRPELHFSAKVRQELQEIPSKKYFLHISCGNSQSVVYYYIVKICLFAKAI